jgi:F-type H+-transporting ATPase subunit alpha
LAAFAQFGSNLDKATQQQLDRGLRLQEILKQPQYKPLSLEDQVVLIYAGTIGLLDDVPADQVSTWQNDLLRHLHTQASDFMDELAEKKSLDLEKVDGEKRNAKLDQLIRDFNASWMPASSE